MTNIKTRRLAFDAAKAAADRKVAIHEAYLAAFAAMCNDPESALSISMDLAERMDDSDEAYEAYAAAFSLATSEMIAAYEACKAAHA